jgi:ATP-dependent Lon protease
VTKLEKELGKPAVASFVSISFHTFTEGDVCRIDVKPSDKPVFVGANAEFYVRMGNSTRAYNPRDAVEYIHTRW